MLSATAGRKFPQRISPLLHGGISRPAAGYRGCGRSRPRARGGPGVVRTWFQSQAQWFGILLTHEGYLHDILIPA